MEQKSVLAALVLTLGCGPLDGDEFNTFGDPVATQEPTPAAFADPRYQLKSVVLSATSIPIGGIIRCTMDFAGSEAFPALASCVTRWDTLRGTYYAPDTRSCTVKKPAEGTVYGCDVELLEESPSGMWRIGHIAIGNQNVLVTTELEAAGNDVFFEHGEGQ